MNTSGLDLLKRNDPSRRVHNPGLKVTPCYTLVLCLRVESTGRQSAVLSVMEMIGEGTLGALCDSIHRESNKVLMTQLSLTNQYTEVILT